MKPPRKGLALALLAATQFVLILDASIVNVALPSIGAELKMEQSDLSWIVNAYTLAFGGFLLLGGRLADLAGRRLMFMAGMGLFTLGSLAGGFATSAELLITARAVQGLGAAVVAPAALSLVMTLFDEGAERNKALGVFGAVAGSGGAAGAILGGVLTEAFGWEAVLFVNVPIGIAAIALAPALLPEARDRSQRGFDLLGALFITSGIGLAVYAIVNAQQEGWGSARTLGELAGAAVLVGLFALVQARSASPLAPLPVLRRLGRPNVVSFLIAATMIPMFFTMTMYVQVVLGYEPLKAGLAQTPVALAIAVSAGLTSNLVTRFGPRVLAAAGFTVVGLGMLWFAQLGAPSGSYLEDVFGPSIVLGIGGGMTWVSTSVAATMGAAPQEAGLASGLLNTTQQIGGTLGLAILVSVAAEVGAGSSAGHPLAVFADGFHTALLTGIGFAVLGALLSLTLKPVPAMDRDVQKIPAAA
ncbi:MFS transporter [Actinocorallia longicatena]|uniref:DHA2 family efflux MFS transporter permease subunit n=1 Tax=Actinocorallia longicatena TaxID=111803 RepID=A0ABP6QFC9_9ACTN